MLVAGAKTAAGRRLLLIGLSAENLRLLQQDKPLKTNLDRYGIAGVDLVLFSGTTDEAMAASLLPAIGPDTVVHQSDEKLFEGHD